MEIFGIIAWTGLVWCAGKFGWVGKTWAWIKAWRAS